MNTNSTVEIQRPDIRLKIVISVAGMIALIILAIVFQGVVIYLIAGFGTVAIVGYALVIRHKNRIRDHEYRRIVATTTIEEEKAKQEAVITRQLELASRLHETKTGVFVADGMSQWTFIPATAQERKALDSGNIIDITPLPNLMDLISEETCIMVYGGRGAGKTTIGLHWLSVRPGQVIVCDPKPRGLNNWPTDNIVGCGGRYDDIERTIHQVRAELARRIKNELLNETDLTLFLDELYQLVIIQQMDIMKPFFEIITIGRDYHVHGGFTSSDKGVKALGIEGMSGLREALTEIRVVKAGNSHQVFVDLGNGEREAKTPGLYYGRNGHSNGKVLLPDIKPQWTTFDILAAAFWQEVDAGTSKNEAYSFVFGGRYGGRDVEKLNEWQATSAFAGMVCPCLEVAEVAEVGIKK